ncbi:putative Zinc finger, MIZ-type, Zinc finger, RING/FYVE/PHD-type [Helianthus annuus]|nr:putative Zinc finger, MIZ-type, Zinc finger, RING/FYVE/PHD-type [Helianthus annuus]KAJ0736612.1 putative Zinc finger, MIZ-type, Zinc finger, RING/FYVE/PHD-type [Helianthus annuus]KAJ0739553.1 putative Zinc finger, MIZ-type, Zinc finger, RING/FYVE/PHD-type [Helianthus annuus]
MTGTVATPVGLAGTVDITGQTLSPAFVNAFRISAVTSRLLAHVRGEAPPDNAEFCNLCLSLARGIDYAVSNNEVPGRAPDLPFLLNKVCQRENDLTSQAAVMVLMISVKSACSNGWFSEKAKEELYVLSKKMQSGFCTVSVNDLNSNLKNKESNLNPTLSTIMSRFYPGMKMGEIFSLVETKPGYDSYVTDLYISKSSRTSPDDKLYLFVAQMDNVETSSCLISPQQVNFLLNGEGVDRRTCTYKDPAPQMPTPVTHMLKYGSNLLQVVGQFNGRYIIVIGFMSVVSNPSFPTIPDYVPPIAAQSDPDNEIIEGPSRVSLKCPISFSRIKIPVKGHSCNHLQCFDFNNYMGINSRRPLWRCPHCSQSVCFLDIRIDQSMVKVLKEVGEDVSYVKISGDGSWQAVTENISNGNEHIEKPNDAPSSNQETATQNVDDIMDLTENDDEMEKVDKDYDQMPSPAGESSLTNNNIAPHTDDGYWRRYCSSALVTGTTNTRSDVFDAIQRQHLIFNSLGQSQGQGQSETGTANTRSDVLDAIQRQRLIFNSLGQSEGQGQGQSETGTTNTRSDVLDVIQRQHLIFSSLGQSQGQSQMHVSNNTQSQHNENSNNNGNGHVRYPTSATLITRIPNAVQALPAQNSAITGQSQPDHSFLSSQSQSQSQTPLQVGARSASPQPISGSRYTSPLSTDRFNSNQYQSLNQRAHLPVRSSGQPSPHVRLGGAHVGVSTMTSLASSQSPTYIQRSTSQIMSQSSSGPVAATTDQRGSTVDAPPAAAAEENWRPAGRMRGSLSGWQYTEALRNQFIIQPSEPVQAARPPPVLNTPRPFIPPHLQALMANNPRPQAGGTSPGSGSCSDGSMAGGPGSDK